ncbi:MAG TPA: hypothetical protein ENL21_01005, partial [Caldithrix abyssi]|nr:hypothetical protein [Caldithrix abyssi]
MKIKFLFLLSLLIFLFNCSSDQQILDVFEKLKQQTQQSYAPDLSMAVFEFQLEKENGQWVLKGETTVPEARSALLQKLDSLLKTKVNDQSLLLPHPDLGDSSWAIVRVSV